MIHETAKNGCEFFIILSQVLQEQGIDYSDDIPVLYQLSQDFVIHGRYRYDSKVARLVFSEAEKDNERIRIQSAIGYPPSGTLCFLENNTSSTD